MDRFARASSVLVPAEGDMPPHIAKRYLPDDLFFSQSPDWESHTGDFQEIALVRPQGIRLAIKCVSRAVGPCVLAWVVGAACLLCYRHRHHLLTQLLDLLTVAAIHIWISVLLSARAVLVIVWLLLDLLDRIRARNIPGDAANMG
jgi:hypothetical protein